MSSQDRKGLPPLIRVWQAPNSKRRKYATLADLLQCGKTAAFQVLKDPRIKVIRLGKRTTLVDTESVFAFLAARASADQTEA